MKKFGFSLMEMMIVLLIVSIVIACSAPMVNQKLAKTEGESPWVFTNAAGSSAYNMSGNNGITSLIGTSRLPDSNAVTNARQYIQANNAPQIGFGGNGNTSMGLTVKNNSIFLTNSDVREVNDSENSILIGTGTASTASADSAIAIGRDAIANRNSAIAIGNNSDATSLQTIAIGVNANATENFAVAIGERATASHENSFAIGQNSKSKYKDTAVFGSEDNPMNVIIYGSLTVGQSGSGTRGSSLTVHGTIDADGSISTNDDIRIGDKIKCDDDTIYGYGYNDRTSSGTGSSRGEGSSSSSRTGSSSSSSSSSSSRTSSSDRRLKDVGEAFTAGLEEIKKLELFNYTYKKDKSNTPQVGVMAQDLQKIFPNAVREGEDGFLRIRWDEMFYATINAIKDLDKKIEKLTVNQKQIEELTKKVEILEKENKDLTKQNKDFEKRFEKLEKQIRDLK